MKKILRIILYLGLVVSLYSTLIISKRSKIINLEYLQSKNSLDECEYIKKRILEKYTQNLFSENKIISNVYLINSEFDTIPIVDFVKNGTKLIYRFYEETCIECVEDELNIVKQLADSLGADNILIISNHKKVNSLKAMINRKGIISPSFVYNKNFNLPIENDENKIASFFLLDETLRTRLVFKAGGNQDINDPYYRRIIDFFNNEY